MASVTWQCPQCGRRVPNRVEECHCGTSREAALQAAAARLPRPGAAEANPAPRPEIAPQYRFSWRALPRDVKLLAAGLIVVLLGGIAWLFVPRRPDPIVPLLGWSEPYAGRKPVPPQASPKPRRAAPSPSPPARKGWLPW